VRTDAPNFDLAFVTLTEACLESFPQGVLQLYSVINTFLSEDGKMLSIVPRFVVLRTSIVVGFITCGKALATFHLYGEKASSGRLALRIACRAAEVAWRSTSIAYFGMLLRPTTAGIHENVAWHVLVLISVQYLGNNILCAYMAPHVDLQVMWSLVFMLGGPPKFLTIFDPLRLPLYILRLVELVVMGVLVYWLADDVWERCTNDMILGKVLIASFPVFGMLIAFEVFISDKSLRQPNMYLPLDKNVLGNEHASSALCMAAEADDVLLCQLLIRLTDINGFDAQDNTALHSAAKGDSTEVMELLLKNQADIGVKGAAGTTALHAAAEQGHIRSLKLLLDSSAPVDETNESQQTALHLAVMNRHIAVVGSLLDYSAEPAAVDSTGIIGLLYADMLRPRHEELVSMLLAHPSDPAACSTDGRTALHISAERPHNEAVANLLAARADTEAQARDRTYSKLTPLHLAALKNHHAVLSTLLSGRANIEAKEAMYESTALHLAAYEGHTASVKVLLAARADMDARNESQGRARTASGVTPLHLATFRERRGALIVLLEARADPSAQDGNGMSSLDYARPGAIEAALQAAVAAR